MMDYLLHHMCFMTHENSQFSVKRNEDLHPMIRWCFTKLGGNGFTSLLTNGVDIAVKVFHMTFNFHIIVI